jgi:adenine-specific DNA-methyltransferase
MGYRFPKETMDRLLAEDRILFGKNESKLIELKVYAKDYRAKLSSVFELDGRRGTNEIKAIFPESKRPFNFPKAVGLIEELLAFTTSYDDLVLDSFAGSGTTAHALMKLNASDGGMRRFVCVEMDAEICQNLTAERIRRVSIGYEKIPGLGGGFRFCKLGKPLFDEAGNIGEHVSFPTWQLTCSSRRPDHRSPNSRGRIARCWESTKARPCICCSTACWAINGLPAAMC